MMHASLASERALLTALGREEKGSGVVFQKRLPTAFAFGISLASHIVRSSNLRRPIPDAPFACDVREMNCHDSARVATISNSMALMGNVNPMRQRSRHWPHESLKGGTVQFGGKRVYLPLNMDCSIHRQ